MSILCSMVGASFSVAAAAEILRAKKGIQAIGNAQIDTAQSKFGGSSILFDGTGDYLTVYNSTDISFGTGDFTWEAWVRLANDNADMNLFDGVGNGDLSIRRTSDGKLQLGRFFVAFDTASTAMTIANTWTHLAVCRTNGTVKLFKDGIDITASGGNNNNSYGISNYAFIGDHPGYNIGVNGHMDEIRISKIARYTSNFTPSTTAFVNDNNTLLLIHANGTDATTFIEDDNGVRAPLGLIAQNQTQISTAQSQFGGSSILFDGNDDYITVSGMPSLTSNYTLEMWARFDILPWNQTLNGGAYIMLATGGSGDYILINRTGAGSQVNIQIATANKYGSFTKSGVNLAINTWYHIAVVRNSGVFKVFFNGTDLTTFTNDSGFTNSGRTENMAFSTIGRFIDARGSMDGYIDEIRVSSSARYTGDFTPSTTPFVNDANTVLLIHGDGTNASTVLRDDNGAVSTVITRTAKTVTAYGNAQIDDAQSKFGGSSVYFDGTDDYLVATGDFSQTGSFTIECWFRPSRVTGNQTIFSVGNESSGRQNIYLNTNTVRINLYAGADLITSSSTVSINTWYHLAIVKNSTTLTMYLNGTSVGSTTHSTTFGNANNFYLGCISTADADYQGWIDEIRISNTARYTANFIPSANSFNSDAATLLLLHCDGPDASTTFTDDIYGYRTQKGIVASGNAQIDTAQSKFGGSSILFDGTGDYLQVANHSDFNFGSNNFTIELFVRATNFTGSPSVMGMATPGGVDGWNLQFGTDGKCYLEFSTNGTSVTTTAVTAAVSTATWTHIAFVRNGNSITPYKDGVAGTAYTFNGSFISSTANLVIGDGFGISTTWSSATDFNGYVDEIRISNTARYTANFTAPTAPFQNDTNTLLLIHGDGTDASTAIFDDNGQVPQTP